jgi:AcrR family transcriptional regulator
MVQRLQELKAGGRLHASTTDRGETTRREILEAAARCFAAKGYQGTSMTDVIKEAGVTKGGFYFHFPSKEALALAVLRHKQEQWAGRVLAATMRHSDTMEQMEAMVEALIELHEGDPSSRSISRICWELSEDPALIPQVAPQFEVWVDMSAQLFTRAQHEGRLRQDLDPHAMGEAAVATFVGLEVMSKVEGRELGPRVRRYVDLFKRAFAAPEATG